MKETGAATRNSGASHGQRAPQTIPGMRERRSGMTGRKYIKPQRSIVQGSKFKP
jgi:hypothetical protein